ncbi:MAG: alpha/beta hydrolase [Ruminococcaceae bacterium]|nr:alpha/beta hydrolase [Oscillospiraceae bacterium]
MTGYIIGAVILLLLLVLVFGTHFFLKIAFFRYTSRKEKKKKSVWVRLEEKGGEVNVKDLFVEARPWIEEIKVGKAYLASAEKKVYETTSYDGLKLRARLFPAENMRAIVIMVHGFRSNPVHDFSLAVMEFNKMGLSCLLPDQRSTGESEGKYICYGRKEKYDIRDWARLMEKEYPGVPVILDGVSMGCSTVLLASGLDLPENVKGIIADCGYTTPYEMFERVLRDTFKLPKFPFFYTASLASKLFLGFDFKGESTVDALKKNRLPVLFAHGEADTLVPHYMSVTNWEAAKDTCDAVFFSVPKAGHGLSYLVDREGYIKLIEELLEKIL